MTRTPTAVLDPQGRLLEPCPPLSQAQPVKLQVQTMGGKTTLHLRQRGEDRTAHNPRTGRDGSLRLDLD